MDPRTRHIRLEDPRIAEHTVTRMDALAPVEAHRHPRTAIYLSLVCHHPSPCDTAYFSAMSSRRALASSARATGANFGYSSCRESMASITAPATTIRVNHLLSAGTTYQGAYSVAVCRIMSSKAAMYSFQYWRSRTSAAE